MAQATYKNIKSDYDNFPLMSSVGIAFSAWREKFGANEYGEFDDEHKQLTVGAVAKAIGERYESVYRIEHGGGTSTTLVKYLLFIRSKDPKFDFLKRVLEIRGSKVGMQDMFDPNPKPMKKIPFKD
ncbi:hypothetical protein [Hallella absiana]|jgi:hypothetical protein|uniref:hypothetical protein n=1 Tax=Hallella absiana TaxID=2925336 RepID=UPI0021CA27BE|nr:hypothetical protein [Hallella absiana]